MMPKFNSNSLARQRFDYLQSLESPDAYLYLAGLVSGLEPTFEHEWLDFKGNPKSKDLDKIWSKALSAFANTTDGLLIWGIDAREDAKTKIDASSNLSLVPKPYQFRSRLDQLLHEATNPPVLGVEMQAYSNSSDQGFVVCFVPESSFKPHRGERAGNQYFVRAGTSSVPAGPGLLRVLFYPQRNTEFDVEITLKCQFMEFQHPNPDPGIKAKFSCSACLKIAGNATARDVYVSQMLSGDSIDFVHKVVQTDWNYLWLGRLGYGFAAKRPLHPGEECDIYTNADFSSYYQAEKIGDFSYISSTCPEPFRLVVHASDQEKQLFEFDFSDVNFSRRQDGTGVRFATRTGKRLVGKIGE